MEGRFPRTGWKHVQGPILNGVHPCYPLFELGVVFRSWPCWTGKEVSFWTRLLHCSGVVSDREVESYPKRACHQPDDHYGRVRGALSLYLPGLGAHFRQYLGGSRACWTLCGFVGSHFPTANGPPVLKKFSHLSGLLLLLCLHLLAPAEELILDGWVYWVGGHSGKFRRSVGMFENFKGFGDQEVTWERVYPSSHVSPLRFLARCFPQIAPIVVF